MKTFIIGSLLTFLLHSAVFADPPPPPPPSSSGSMLRASVVVSSGKLRPRQFELITVDTACASMTSKDADARLEDHIQLCPRGSDRLHIEWTTREGPQEYRGSASVLIRPGARFDIDGHGAKLSLTLR